MLAEADPTHVVEQNAAQYGRGDRKTGEHARPELLRVGQPRHGRRNGDKSTGPRPPGRGSYVLCCRQGLAGEKLDQHHTGKAAQVNPGGSPDRLLPVPVQFSIRILERIQSPGGDCDHDDQPLHTIRTQKCRSVWKEEQSLPARVA